MKGKNASIFMADIAEEFHLFLYTHLVIVEVVAAVMDQSDVDLHN